MSEHETHLSPFSTGFKNKCPRCGEGKLFGSFLKVKAECSACGLQYDFEDAGDGPAVFIILLAGLLVVGLVLFVQVKFSPPMWLQFLIWFPIILFVCLAPLQPLKGLMIAQQYNKKASEGKQVSNEK